MDKRVIQEIPFRSKLEMLKDIAIAIEALQSGEKETVDSAIHDLKLRALMLDSTIQQDVLIFSEQVVFQYDYDPWHLITKEVQMAADKLIEDLGFQAPSMPKWFL